MKSRAANDALRRPRQLVLILGDQLDAKSAAFDGFDPKLDAVWMAEVAEESTHVWSHKARIALFLAAMRHFRDALRERGFIVHYQALEDTPNAGTLAEELLATADRLTPQKLIVVQPGEWRVEQSFHTAARQLGLELEMRRKHAVLMDGDQPVGERGTSPRRIGGRSAKANRNTCARSHGASDPTRSRAK